MTLANRLIFFKKLIKLVRNWPTYLLHRLQLLPQKETTFRLRNGVRITSRAFTIDRSAINDVWIDESYEPTRIGRPWTWNTCRWIIDIGANIGTFTLYAAHHAPLAEIDAVEPEPGNIALVQKNISQNGLGNRVTLHKAAIGTSETMTTLHLCDQVSGGHSMFRHAGHTTSSVTVPTITLHSLFEKRPTLRCDLLKLDCEGGEYDALMNLPPSMLERVQAIAVEVHTFSVDPKHQPTVLQSFLEKAGFSVMPLKKSMLWAER